jgi:hypothetical protein
MTGIFILHCTVPQERGTVLLVVRAKIWWVVCMQWYGFMEGYHTIPTILPYCRHIVANVTAQQARVDDGVALMLVLATLC